MRQLSIRVEWIQRTTGHSDKRQIRTHNAPLTKSTLTPRPPGFLTLRVSFFLNTVISLTQNLKHQHHGRDDSAIYRAE